MEKKKRTEVGLHMNLVKFLVIFVALRTCSSDHPSRNCEYGLFKECLWFFEAALTSLQRE